LGKKGRGGEFNPLSKKKRESEGDNMFELCDHSSKENSKRNTPGAAVTRPRKSERRKIEETLGTYFKGKTQ